MAQGIGLAVGTYPPDPADLNSPIRCLENGTFAAARFAADLAAVVALARSTPPLPDVAPTSQASAELAVRLKNVWEGNAGCDSCGGYTAAKLAPSTWHDAAPGATTRTGTVNAIAFTATFAAAGWAVDPQAC